MKNLAIAMGLAALVAGCQTIYKNDGGDADLRPAIVRDIAYEKYDINSTPVEATDNRVGLFKFLILGGISGHYADNAPGGFFDAPVVAAAKNGAYAAACETAKCDTLVGARYTIDYRNYFFWEEATVKVVGYPAKLTGVEFRKAKLD